MTPRPRVFVSYSNGDPDAEAYLAATQLALTAAGWDVLIDRDRLLPGVEWRDELYTWMGLCHAAVVLVSESVLRGDSIWVPREAGILLWRRALDPTFTLVPACVGPVTPAQLDQGPLRDLQLGGLQSVRGETPPALKAALAARFKAGASRQTPLEELAGHALAQLDGVGAGPVEQAAAALGVDLGPWKPHDDPRRTLALALLQVPLAAAVDAFATLAEYLEPEKAERLLMLLAPSWVDRRAARWLADVGMRGAGRPTLVLNASTGFAARTYVDRASHKPAWARWPLVEVTGVLGEDAAAEAVAEVERNLMARLVVADAFAVTPRVDLDDVLAEYAERRWPVFVVLQLRPPIAAVLAALQHEFPSVTFVLLSGDDFPEPAVLDGRRVHLVEPPLARDAERRARRAFNGAHGRLPTRAGAPGAYR